jgi:cystathionine beta-lyase
MRNPFDMINEAALRRRRTAKWTEFGIEVLPAAIAEMDFPVAEPIRDALHDCIERGEMGYAVRELSGFARICADYLDRAHGWAVRPDQVYFAPDVLDGLAAALNLVSRPGGAVVVPTPSFPPLIEVIGVTGRTVVPVPLAERSRRPTLDLPGINAALAQGADTVLLCNPHNPTGRVFDAGELTGLAEVVAARHARVVSDEVYAPLCFPGHRHLPYARVSRQAADQVVTLLSASKAWNIAGLKCSQLVLTNDADLARWRGQSPFAVGGLSPFAIAATSAAYQQGEPWRVSVLRYLDGNRRLLGRLLADQLPAIGYLPAEGTYLAWLDCRELGLPEPAAWFREHARVGLSEGAEFGAQGAGHVRLNFATSSALLRQIVDAMAAAIM